MSYAYQNLKTPVNVGSGIAEMALIAPVSDLTTIQCPVGPFGVTPGDEITITTAHVFAAGRGFIQFQLAPLKNSLLYKTVGELGLSKQNGEADIFIPGSYAQAHEAIKNLINTPLIVLLKDANCEANLWYQFGCDCSKAWLTAEFTTGTTSSGVKGYTAKIIYDGGPLFYNVDGGPALLP